MMSSELNNHPLQPQRSVIRKIAAFLFFLESDRPGITPPIFKEIGSALSKKVLEEMSNLERLDKNQLDEIVAEFYDLSVNKQMVFGGRIVSDGIGRNLFDNRESDRDDGVNQPSFSFLNHLADERILAYMDTENDQMVALLLSYLEPKRAAALFERLGDRAGHIAARMLALDVPSQSLIWELQCHLENVIADNFSSSNADDGEVGCVSGVSRIFELLPLQKKSQVLAAVKQTIGHKTADVVQAAMVEFEEIFQMGAADLETLFVECPDPRRIAVALKDLDLTEKNKVLSHLSTRMRTIVQDEMQRQGDVKEEKIFEAQQQLILLARRLEDLGKIAPMKGRMKGE